MKKLSQEEVISRFKEIHKNKYDYSESVYVNAKTPIVIICTVHGKFEQIPDVHKKCGCPKCGFELSNYKRTKEIDDVISDFKKIHGDKYIYDNLNYLNRGTNVSITCKIHGAFNQTPRNHMLGHGCPSCSNNNKMDWDIFEKKAKETHFSKYSYIKQNKINVKSYIIAICKDHGEFKTKIGNHLYLKRGCPDCAMSKGEEKIEYILKSKDIKYEKQKMFEDLRLKNKLKFDFYLPEYNTCIEYDGKQHFEPVDQFGGVEYLEYVQICDSLKVDYCAKMNINLLRISYKEYHNIENILIKYVKN